LTCALPHATAHHQHMVGAPTRPLTHPMPFCRRLQGNHCCPPLKGRAVPPPGHCLQATNKGANQQQGADSRVSKGLGTTVSKGLGCDNIHANKAMNIDSAWATPSDYPATPSLAQGVTCIIFLLLASTTLSHDGPKQGTS